MNMTTFTDIISGTIVLFGVYAVFRLLRYVADVVIFLIALTVAMVACCLNSWYPTMMLMFDFLPSALDFKGRVMCLAILILLGALLALPVMPFSSIIRNMRSGSWNRRHRPQPDRTKRLPAGQNLYPEEKMYRWDHVNDL
jgi:hypothetical protein